MVAFDDFLVFTVEDIRILVKKLRKKTISDMSQNIRMTGKL